MVEGSSFSTMSNIKEVWLISLPSDMYSATDEHINALIIGFVFTLLALIAPTLCCLSWLLQWTSAFFTGTTPSCSKHRYLRWLAAASPYLYGWCAADVFWSSAAAGCLEMDLSVQFIVKHKAGALCDQIHNLTGEQCVHVGGSLLPGGWWMLAFVILSGPMCFLTTKLCMPEKLVAASSMSGNQLPLRLAAQEPVTGADSEMC